MPSTSEMGLPCGEALCVTDSDEGGGFCSCDPRSPHENRESKKRSSLRRTGIWLVIERSRTPRPGELGPFWRFGRGQFRDELESRDPLLKLSGIVDAPAPRHTKLGELGIRLPESQGCSASAPQFYVSKNFLRLVSIIPQFFSECSRSSSVELLS